MESQLSFGQVDDGAEWEVVTGTCVAQHPESLGLGTHWLNLKRHMNQREMLAFCERLL